MKLATCSYSCYGKTNEETHDQIPESHSTATKTEQLTLFAGQGSIHPTSFFHPTFSSGYNGMMVLYAKRNGYLSLCYRPHLLLKLLPY